MANKFHNPKSVALAGKYSLGCEVPAGARVLFVAGQVGLDGAGKLADGIEAQCDQVWKNIGEVLKAADMGYGDIVKITGTDRSLQWTNGWGYWQLSFPKWTEGSALHKPITTTQA